MGISTNIIPRIGLLEAASQLSSFCRTIELEIENDAKEIIKSNEAYEKNVEALSKLKRSRNLTFSIHAPHKGYESNLA
ncbi:MAG: hypothetical protein AAF152_14345, partial [Cyanobacteria bacterium P01_A01_bin.114]